MKRLLPLWLLILVALVGGAWGTYVSCPGCIDRNRVNQTCEWTSDTVFPIDPQNAAHQKHLVADAQLAEELAIRHADAEFGRRFGIEHHGGLIDDGRFREECLSRLFQSIENNHHVTPEQVRVARGVRNRTFDLAVVLLFLPFYSVGATVASLWLSRRFASDGRLVRWVAAALASVTVSFLGLQFLRLWGAVWEVVRVGNGHMAAHPGGFIHPMGSAPFRRPVHRRHLAFLARSRCVATGSHGTNTRKPVAAHKASCRFDECRIRAARR